tara:strand:- start:252 stop:584 length:333 start_codon:yes stop_codon:yes gene_type:complete
MFKKIIYIMFIFFLVSACTNTYDSVKRGLTGAKANSTDEFMVQKKDPLILPPDYENLPEPGEAVDSITNEIDEISSFEKVLEASNTNEDDSISSSSSSTESSILKKIQSK